MFIGSWLINVAVGVIAFLFVFIGSLSTNSLFTSSLRGSFAFLLFYLLGYLFRWLWMLAFKRVELEKTNKDEIEQSHQGEASKKEEFTDEEIEKTSRYVKDLIND